VLTSELSGYRVQQLESLAPKLEELNIAAGRFSRHDAVRRAILDLHNALVRMLIAKKTNSDEVESIRIELVTDLALLLKRCDEVISGKSKSDWMDEAK
jgi:hypothetical protein